MLGGGSSLLGLCCVVRCVVCDVMCVWFVEERMWMLCSIQERDASCRVEDVDVDGVV